MSDHLAMSDEDFLKQPVPETGQASSDMPPADTSADAQTPAPTEDTQAQPENSQDNPAPDKVDEPVADAPADPAPEADKPKAEGEPDAAKDTPAPGSDAKPAADSLTPEPINYEGFYQQIMKPFKANGKDIQLKTPEEAIQLMQMGANFTRKMQEIAPHRKILTMLDRVQLLDEDKLSFLIDLDKGDPEAIKKFIKDKGVDPLDIDTTTEPAYREGSHKVSDADQKFATVLDELNSTPDGRETLVVVEKTWDQSSKDMLWSQPEVLPIIQAQRETGIYDRIVAEVDRQKTLGHMPADKPFLEAYQVAGDHLHSSGAFADILEKAGKGTPAPGAAATVDTQAGKPAPTPVATTVAKPQSDVAATDKAAAAAPSRATPATAKAAVNVLAMSDEEFLKLGRLPS